MGLIVVFVVLLSVMDYNLHYWLYMVMYDVGSLTVTPGDTEKQGSIVVL